MQKANSNEKDVWLRVLRLSPLLFLLGMATMILFVGTVYGYWNLIFKLEAAISYIVIFTPFIIVAILYTLIFVSLHRADSRNQFNSDDPIEVILLCCITSLPILALIVTPITETFGRLLNLEKMHFGEGLMATAKVMVVPSVGTWLLFLPLQFLRPWRNTKFLIARVVAAIVYAICATKFIALYNFNTASLIITIIAFLLALAVIRFLDWSWTKLSGSHMPDGTTELTEPEIPHSNYRPDGSRPVGIALSGGGYRASLFSLGALIYIREACRVKDSLRKITEISSVSGGSVTNAAIAQAGSLSDMDDASFAQLTRAIFQQATGAGSMFSGIAAKFYYIALLPLSIVALTLLLWYVFHKVPLLTIGKGVVIFVSLSALLISADKLSDIANKAPKRAWTPSGDMVILIALGIFLAEILIIFTLPDWRMGLSVLGALLATAAGIAYVWNLRGWLIENKFDEMLQRIGTGTKLGNISSDMHHVFCACEVQLSEMIYLSQHAIFAPSLGIFSSINIPTARAVRASAAFPFAFPPVFLPGVPIGRLTWNDPRDIKNRLSLLRRFMMVDGGVRDNLGVAWFEEFETLIEELVVISAAPNRRHRSVISALPGLNELYALLRQSFMPYEDRERLRRRHLSTQLLSKMWRNEPKVAGLVLHIEDSPYDLPVILVARSSSGGESFANARWQRLHRMFPDRVVDQIIAVEKLWGASGDQGKALIERASAAWEHLKKIEQTLPPIGDLIADDRDLAIKADIIKIMRLYNFPMIPDQSMVAWYQRTSKSTQVKTKLSAIQVEDAKNLLLHGYYLACTNLHIVLNWPLLEGLNNKSFAELYEN